MSKIHLDNVSLKFHVKQLARSSLKDWIVRHILRQPVPEPMQVEALKNISLTIEEGERVGLIGHNGAGKSTLLRVLAGIYPPTAGKVHVEGQISSLFDILLGFEPDATGWENIRFRGYLQGETPRTMRDKQQSIAEFSELGRFLDMPLRYYSAGMAVRLAFAIATAIDPEILLVDEVLSVGDQAFQHKAQQRMQEMMARARLIVLVSHDMSAIETLCDRVIWLDHGQVRAVGTTHDIIQNYVREAEPPDLNEVTRKAQRRQARQLAMASRSRRGRW